MRLLDAIGEAEGSRPGYWEGNPYDMTIGRGKYSGAVNVSEMTVGDIKLLQLKMVKNGAPSGAVGKYQFINKTLKDLQKKIGFTDNAVFDASLQDRMALELLNRRGFRQFQNGTLSLNDFMKNLSKEWASLPNPGTGKSYYGQRTHFTVEQMKEILCP
jgi:muramidase (phage lysozyme)